MHGLTGGSWKRSTRSATDDEKNRCTGKLCSDSGSTAYRHLCHRASSRPSNLIMCWRS